ncbi:MAG: chemotaxis protein MotA [Candidatus Azotimanducaceae bacterium]|jgi:chemotaxis protein MotA
MDFLSILGVCIAFAAIITGNILEGGDLDSLVNAPAALVVFGGTLGAIILQTPFSVLMRGFSLLSWMLFPPKISTANQLKKILFLSRTARKDGLLGLENQAEREKDRLLRKGLRLLTDGYEPDKLRHRLEEYIVSLEQRDCRAASIFDHMGGYAPTIGIIGAVMGLIHVMGNLDNPEMVGSGIATAFVATIYGVGLANLILYPIAGKLRELIREYIAAQLLLVEGLVAIAEGEHPKVIESRLNSLAGAMR